VTHQEISNEGDFNILAKIGLFASMAAHGSATQAPVWSNKGTRLAITYQEQPFPQDRLMHRCRPPVRMLVPQMRMPYLPDQCCLPAATVSGLSSLGLRHTFDWSTLQLISQGRVKKK